MKLLANENFPLPAIEVLLELGYDVLAIASKHKGIPDSEVMRIANDEELLSLLTATTVNSYSKTVINPTKV